MEAGGDVETMQSDQPDPHVALSLAIETEQLRGAIEELPAEFREVVVLKDLQGLSYRQIAEIIEVPIGTVMSRLSRGRQRLTEKLCAERGKVSPMECNQMRELISAYADGELDAQAARRGRATSGKLPGMFPRPGKHFDIESAMRADALLYNVPGALGKKIDTMVRKAADPTAGLKGKPSRPLLQLKHVLMATAAAAILAAGITGYWMWPSARQRIEADAVQDHKQCSRPIISLMCHLPILKQFCTG